MCLIEGLRQNFQVNSGWGEGCDSVHHATTGSDAYRHISVLPREL